MSSATLPAPPWRVDARLIGLVGVVHGISHFAQLLLAPLFPWLKDAFGVSYAELGFLLTVFFVVSCVVQAASGFWVDRHGPRPVLLAGLGLIGLGALGYATSTGYTQLLLSAVVAGVGNGVFHPVDYTLINRKVHPSRLGHAYSAHGITGSLGWALAPALMVPLTLAFGWRMAMLCAALLIFAVLALALWQREATSLGPARSEEPSSGGSATVSTSDGGGGFDFLRIPAVWMCFAFFFFYAGALSVVQSFAPEAARQLHGVPLRWAALCLSIYMVCSAAGMLAGGFLARDAQRCERIVGTAFGAAALIALWIGFGPVPAVLVPVLFGLMGFVLGSASPSRDLLVKQSSPDNASGRVYGVVYGGMDVGQALVPLLIGSLMDHQRYREVFLVMALLQAVLVANAFSVRRARRAPAALPAPG